MAQHHPWIPWQTGAIWNYRCFPHLLPIFYLILLLKCDASNNYFTLKYRASQKPNMQIIGFLQLRRLLSWLTPTVGKYLFANLKISPTGPGFSLFLCSLRCWHFLTWTSDLKCPQTLANQGEKVALGALQVWSFVAPFGDEQKWKTMMKKPYNCNFSPISQRHSLFLQSLRVIR